MNKTIKKEEETLDKLWKNVTEVSDDLKDYIATLIDKAYEAGRKDERERLKEVETELIRKGILPDNRT